MSEEKKLTDKQKRFCEEYVIDNNATQAATRAGYSAKTANEQGSRMLAKVSIQEEIANLRKEIQERNNITVDEIIRELAEQFRVDPTEVYDNNGNLKPLTEMSDRARKSIKSISKQIDESASGARSIKGKVEFYNKQDSADKLLRHLGGYEKDNEQSKTNISIDFKE